MPDIRPNILLQGLMTSHAAKGVYRPEVGHTITVSLPGEKVRAEVAEVVSFNAVLAVVGVTFRQGNGGPAKGQKIPVIRDEDDMGVEIWRMVAASELQQNTDEETFRQQEIARAREVEEAHKQRRIAAEQAELAQQRANSGHPEPVAVTPSNTATNVDEKINIAKDTISSAIPHGTDQPIKRPVLGPRRSRVTRVG